MSSLPPATAWVLARPDGSIVPRSIRADAESVRRRLRDGLGTEQAAYDRGWRVVPVTVAEGTP